MEIPFLGELKLNCEKNSIIWCGEKLLSLDSIKTKKKMIGKTIQKAYIREKGASPKVYKKYTKAPKKRTSQRKERTDQPLYGDQKIQNIYCIHGLHI